MVTKLSLRRSERHRHRKQRKLLRGATQSSYIFGDTFFARGNICNRSLIRGTGTATPRATPSPSTSSEVGKPQPQPRMEDVAGTRATGDGQADSGKVQDLLVAAG